MILNKWVKSHSTFSLDRESAEGFQHLRLNLSLLCTKLTKQWRQSPTFGRTGPWDRVQGVYYNPRLLMGYYRQDF